LQHPLTEAVHALMREAAAKAILPRYQALAEHEISEKAADDFVTIADTESEAILTAGLARLLPDAAVVGEEATYADATLLDRLGEGLCWIVDPVDGTWNFSHGQPPFGIIVALADRGETLAGWLYDPLAERLCHAHLGCGAWIDGERIRARTTGREPPVAAIGLAYMDEDKRAGVQREIVPHYETVAIPRCAAEQYPRLVLGQNDISIFERTLPWDHAAGVLFLNEAGGKAARHDGSPYRVDDRRRGLLGAASPRLWEELAARMQKVPAEA
jgi:fructose-1,6-bisphosphatase/inositol monophosphatase family enzyme